MEKKESDEVEVVDPLSNYWGLNLFPSTSSAFPISDDLDAVHNHLLSMALQSPGKLVEQTKSILEENPGLFNSEDERNDVVAEEAQEFPRKRRPGLGLKRARFSLKPTTSASVENLLPNLDIDSLKDPAQFFKAHERMENAKREIQKQMGGVAFEPNRDDASTKPRQRRPGLRGNDQRSIRYRHRYPTETSDKNDHAPSSQGAFGSDTFDHDSEKIDNIEACLTSFENEVTGEENEVADSSATEGIKLGEILDGLLSCNPEDLEGDGAINLLQERLQIKPVVLEKVSVPDFPDNQPIDMKSFRGSLSKPRKALADVDNLLKGMKNKTPLRQDAGSPAEQLASPTPPRSPFAPFSSLQKHISRSKPSVDPFSAHDIDNLSATKYSPVHVINQELNVLDSGKPSNELNDHITKDAIAIGEKIAVPDTLRNSASASENSKEDNSGMSSNKLDTPLIEDLIAVSETGLVEDAVRNCTSTSEMPMEDNSREPEFDANVDSNEPHADMDVDNGGNGMGKTVMDGTVGKPNIVVNELCQVEDEILAENTDAFTASMPTDDTNIDLVNPLADQSSSGVFQSNSTDKCTRRTDDDSEQHLQEETEGTRATVGKKRVKSRSQKDTKSKRLGKRQSLAAAGTSWESGTRRSTRIRTRPLEYWKGERWVIGRIHESCVSVLGVKCMSPGSDGKPIMKVKSFVPDKHKELFALASRH